MYLCACCIFGVMEAREGGDTTIVCFSSSFSSCFLRICERGFLKSIWVMCLRSANKEGVYLSILLIYIYTYISLSLY